MNRTSFIQAGPIRKTQYTAPADSAYRHIIVFLPDCRSSVCPYPVFLHSLPKIKAPIPHHHQFRYTSGKQPFLKESPTRFSISHSSGMAACAVSRHTKVGLDIERVTLLKLELIRPYFNADDWNKIMNAPDTYAEFYRQWTIHEAVLKTLGIPIDEVSFRDINISDRTARSGKKTLYYFCPVIHDDYKYCITSEVDLESIEFIEIHPGLGPLYK